MDDDDFGFQKEDTFYKKQEQNRAMQENSEHLRQINSISRTFFATLQEQNMFNHDISWRSYSTSEPIKIQINTNELLPGAHDLIYPHDKETPSKPEESFMQKVLDIFTTLFCEIENVLSSSCLNPYELLYSLSMYNDSPDDSFTLKPNEENEQISRMTAYLFDLYQKAHYLFQISQNLFHQLFSLYGIDEYYKKYFEHIKFELPFDYIGLIFSFYLAIDTIISKNEEFKQHWETYRTVIYNLRSKVTQYNTTEEQFKQLEKMLSKVHGLFIESKCFELISKKFSDKVKEMKIGQSQKTFQSIVENKSFMNVFIDYLKTKFTSIENNLDSMSDTNEHLNAFKTIALFGLYLVLVPENKDRDKKLLLQAWSIQKKIPQIHIVGNNFFDVQIFFLKYNLHNAVKEDVRAINKKRLAAFESTLSTLPTLINNLRHTVMLWVTKIENDIFASRLKHPVSAASHDQHEKDRNKREIQEKSKDNVKIILNGISLANFIRRTIVYTLESHVSLQKATTEEEIVLFTTGIELLKVIEHQYYKMMPYIALEINILNRSLMEVVQDMIKKFKVIIDKKKDSKSDNKKFYYATNQAYELLFNNTNAAPTRLRRMISQLCIEALCSYPKLLDKQEDAMKFTNIFWEITTLNQLSKEIQRACDCSFLYWYQNIIESCLTSIYNNKPKRLYFFANALNDCETPLLYIRHRENNGMEFIKYQRKFLFSLVEEHILKKMTEEIDKELRKIIHAVLISGLYSPEKTDHDLNDYLTITPFTLFDKVIDPKRYVEEDLNLRFYKLATMNTNDWKTYQQMRVLAKSKYGLNLHEVFLPNHNLEQGEDMIEICRKLLSFSKNYTHNLHSQMFIEIVKDKEDQNYLKVIGVQQILSSLYTHGTGIVNTMIYSIYQQLSKLLQRFLNILSDQYITSLLKEEQTFWMKNKQQIKYFYPYENAEEVRKKIKDISDQQYQTDLAEEIIKLIKQIGNVVALTRCIRTALMNYNSQNANLISTGSPDDFGKLTEQIILKPDDQGINATGLSQNLLTNAQNTFKETNKMFTDTISSLKQTGDNNKNYLKLLVTSYEDSISQEKMPGIDLFTYLFPALTITFIEKLINAREQIERSTKGIDQYFSDDGFIMGICYLNKLFKTDFMFDSLNWFPSVLRYFEEQKQDFESKKQGKKNNASLNVTISGKKILTYLEEFRMLHYTYSSAVILFSE